MGPKNIDSYLSAIYYKPRSPASFSGAYKLWEVVKWRKNRPKGLNLKAVRNWLKLQDTHAIHLIPRKRFRTEKVITEYMDQIWQGDLIDLSALAVYNDDYKFIAVFIDLFSRFLWAAPLKTKKSLEASRALQNIINTSRRKPETLTTDQGKEYTGKPFQEALQTNGIAHVLVYGQHKAAFAERVNRTIQDKLYKYFYEKQTLRYADILKDIVSSYNNTIHGSIKMAPAAVTRDNSMELYDRVYLPILTKRAHQKVDYAFEIGDLVRLARWRTPFGRGYDEQYTEEIFKIRNRIPSDPPRYKVQDLLQEPVLGSFYEQELLRIHADHEDDILFKIERVISSKKVRGEKYSLIKWYGYAPKFNSYIKAKDIVKYQGK